MFRHISPAHGDREHAAPTRECGSAYSQHRLPAASESPAAVSHPLSSSLSSSGNTALTPPSAETIRAQLFSLVLQKEHSVLSLQLSGPEGCVRERALILCRCKCEE